MALQFLSEGQVDRLHPHVPTWPPAMSWSKATWWAWPGRRSRPTRPARWRSPACSISPRRPAPARALPRHKVYWDATNKVATATDQRATSCWARRVKAAADGDATVRVRLSQ